MWTLNTFPPNPPPPSPKKPLKPKPLLHHSLSKSSHLDEALSLLLKSHPSILPTTPTTNLEAYSHLLHSFITHKSLRHAELLHRHLLHSTPSLLRHPLIKSKLITLYPVCARIESARLVFDEDDDDEPSWTAMVVAFSKNGLHEDSLSLYAGNASWRSDFADSAALKSCSALSAVRLGRAVHARVLKSAREPDQVVLNALVRLYVKCGTLDEALRAFDGMPQRNVVSWNSLLSGFVGRGFFFECLDLLRRMWIESSVGFSWVTLTTVLSACSQITALYKGREVHAQMVKSREEPDIVVLNSLMDMHAKCGVVEYCERVFRGMGSRDLTSWNTMLTCYAIGCAHDALELFDEMVGRGRGGIKPDGVTFVALLSSCAHAGFVDEGRRLFDRMDVEFRVRKNVEHFACLVDLLGRAGLIDEAFEVTEKMPMRPGGSVWGSLLNSCRLHGDVELGEIAAKRLFEIEPNNAGNYVLFSNMFAREKMWEEAKKVRVAMEEKGLKKEVGRSWVQVGSGIHSFVAGGGVSFRSSLEYKRVWEELVESMEREGYVPDTDVVLHDVDEGTKAEWVCGHSERIAVVFGLVNSGDGIPIRIMKNLRVCDNCHNVMKVVSKVTRRLIVMRDTNRFHHFRNGACSCGDFW
ncbi:Pentatricopeptide repeat-containing protein [Acorus calamus]|uniref:Pentatricopeptide repeat-containing protein n=1 Tax=Acorus calamus TaxID=4465 RepID=A0AAV9EUJ1_ACOCL|nr:Pentatricopeptide repeat-containing protein [Acorus calamus]